MPYIIINNIIKINILINIIKILPSLEMKWLERDIDHSLASDL